jgi:hypothetical protein
MRKDLDAAYNNAIMATFAPIQAFSGPMPKLSNPQDGVERPWLVGTPGPQTPERVSRTQPPQAQPPQTQPTQAQRRETARTAPSYSRRASPAPSFSDSELEGLVEDVPASFSDADLLKMNVEELRKSYAPQEEETGFFTLGIEDRLLRYYVKAYLVFALFELAMRLSLGGDWVGAMESFNHYSIILPTFYVDRMEHPSLAAAISMSPPSTLMWIVSSFVSIAYLFCCSLPMPIVTRFFILGQPPENGAAHWTFAFLSIVAAVALYSLTGFLFRFLPLSCAGSGMNLAFIAPSLCLGTMRYEGY